MSAETLITDNLDLWTGAITKRITSGRGSNKKIELTGIHKLRHLILELACHGKIVPQLASETPACEVLEGLQLRRKELIRKKKIKNSKPLPNVSADEKPSKLPSNWVWTRLGSIAEINPRNSAEDATEASFVPMPLITTSYHGDHGHETKPWGKIKKGYTHFADGDVALAKITPCFENSKAAVFRGLINGLGAGTTELHVARPLSNAVNPYYLILFLKSPRFLIEGEKVMTGSAGQKRVPKDYFSSTPLPLPPTEEQHRIVQKVDELMALCDQLEQQTNDQLAAHDTLVDTLLGTLTQSQNATELAENWSRLAAHFDTLFTTEQSIEKLKQTILELGITGKFKTSIAPRHVQKSGMERSSSKDSKAGAIPTHWKWTSIAEVATEFQNGASSRGDKEGQDIIVLRLADIENGEIKIKEPRRLKIGNKSIKKYRLNKGDLLIIRVNGSADLVGRFIHVQDNNEAIYCDHFIRMRIDESLVNPDYLTLVGSSKVVRSRIEDLFVSTAGQKTVNQKHINSLKIPLPPIEEQRSIMEEVARLFSMCDGLALKVRNAAETQLHLAETLSSQAISG